MFFYDKLSLKILSFIGVSLIVLGCSPSTITTETIEANAPAQPTVSSTVATEPAQDAQSSSEKIKFKQADGAEKYSLKPMPDGAKLVDGADNELARLTLDGNKIKIKDAADTALGYVVSQEGYWKLENAAQTEELYILRLQADGDLKLEDGADQPIYRIKVRDYGYEIETPEKQSLYKVKAKDGKISLRDASENTVLSTKSAMVPVAMTPFGFEVLTPPQQAALAYAVNLSGGR